MLPAMTTIPVAYYADPSCPFGYSAVPAVRAIDWRYGDQLDWTLHLIGLSEDTAAVEAKGFTPLMMAQFQGNFARWGMPFDKRPKSRLAASSPACRAIVAVRIDAPGREFAALRALQLGNFTDGVLLDEPADIQRALDGVAGIDAAAIVARIEDDDVWAAYRTDLAQTRTAAGTAGARQGKTGFDGDLSAIRRRPSCSSSTDARSTRAACSRWRPTTCSSRTSTRASNAPPRPSMRGRSSIASPKAS